VASPSRGHGEFCEFVYAHGLSVHQKCSNHALTNLLLSLWKFTWITDSLVIRPCPHLEPSTWPSTPKVLWIKEHPPILFFFPLFSFLNSHLNLSKNVQVCQTWIINTKKVVGIYIKIRPFPFCTWAFNHLNDVFYFKYENEINGIHVPFIIGILTPFQLHSMISLSNNGAISMPPLELMMWNFTYSHWWCLMHIVSKCQLRGSIQISKHAMIWWNGYLFWKKYFERKILSGNYHVWRAPKFLVRPKKGPTILKSESSWNLVPLPASSTKGGERGMLKASKLD
jgi:hypothetical protein